MDEVENIAAQAPQSPSGQTRAGRRQSAQSLMSYKFQRLREKLRVAIASGELSGKLPGERTLAKRFHVNAKTLSKALTDLAAEGVLNRSIGRGTFVKGSAPPTAGQGRWLVLCDPEDVESSLVQSLRAGNPELQVCRNVSEIRPSFLSQFDAVLDAASHTPETFLRNLVVRNMLVVAVNREPKTYSTHSVVLDVALGASRLGRDLALAGHRRIAAIEPRGSTSISIALRSALARCASDAVVDACGWEDVNSVVEAGATAIVCGSCAAAEKVKIQLQKAGVRVPAQVSLAAVGCSGTLAPCSGYYCSAAELAEAVIGLLRDGPAARPATLWLAGGWHDLGTTGPTAAVESDEPPRLRTGAALM